MYRLILLFKHSKIDGDANSETFFYFIHVNDLKFAIVFQKINVICEPCAQKPILKPNHYKFMPMFN